MAKTERQQKKREQTERQTEKREKNQTEGNEGSHGEINCIYEMREKKN